MIRVLLTASVRRYALMIGMAVLPLSTLRVLLLRACGIKIGRGCYIGFNVMVDTNFTKLITIGNNVTISHDCSIVTHTLTPAKTALSNIFAHKKEVIIHSGSWIGTKVLILPGAEIGENTFIGAGSVVTSKMPPNTLCAGNPCRLIKYLQTTKYSG